MSCGPIAGNAPPVLLQLVVPSNLSAESGCDFGREVVLYTWTHPDSSASMPPQSVEQYPHACILPHDRSASRTWPRMRPAIDDVILRVRAPNLTDINRLAVCSPGHGVDADVSNHLAVLANDRHVRKCPHGAVKVTRDQRRIATRAALELVKCSHRLLVTPPGCGESYFLVLALESRLGSDSTGTD
jgi:hypothetical protein